MSDDFPIVNAHPTGGSAPLKIKSIKKKLVENEIIEKSFGGYSRGQHLSGQHASIPEDSGTVLNACGYF